MVLAGRRPVEIAAKLQRTKHAVARRAQLLRLSFKLIVLSRQQPKVSHDGAHVRPRWWRQRNSGPRIND